MNRLFLLVSRPLLRNPYSPTAKKMNCTGDDARLLSTLRRTTVPGGGSAIRCESVETCGPCHTDRSKTVSYEQKLENSVGLEDLSGKSFAISSYDHEFPPLMASASSGSKYNISGKRSKVEHGLDRSMEYDDSLSPCERLQSPNWASHTDETSLVAPSGIRTPSPSVQKNRRNSVNKNWNENPVPGAVTPFDICLLKDRRDKVKRKDIWIKKDETEPRVDGGKHVVLSPGMVLLKQQLTLNEQVDIVKTCREFGIKPGGGFYQPGYKDGAKLRLQMMCLGLNWDPETKYAVKHDGRDRKPPDIPRMFNVLVQRAIKDAHALIEKDSGLKDAEIMLPGLSPDICIVNFYTETGRLGLHQDRDESPESIQKGLPVVSFSIGNSAEFLYGENRDLEKAEKVVLESGDVLIFGGDSRLIFHGVKSIVQNSAPKSLLHKSGLRPGRLNLTFRKF